MPRVEDAAVKEIIDVGASTKLCAFIESASLLVDRTAALGTPTMSAAQLANIELWLAAHFVSILERENRLTELNTDDITTRYGGQYGMGLSSSLYGQTAMALDTTGELEKLSKVKATLRTIDTAP